MELYEIFVISILCCKSGTDSVDLTSYKACLESIQPFNIKESKRSLSKAIVA